MVEDVIKNIPEPLEAKRKEWRKAADTWRLPYWDWAVKKSRPNPSPEDPNARKTVYDLPIIARNPRIEVLDYTSLVGATTEIDNPMYQFKIPGGVNMGSLSVNDMQQRDANNDIITIPV